MSILDVFYNEIIPEASVGKVESYCVYNVLFSTKVLDKEYISDYGNGEYLIPTLNIKNKEEFDSLLVEYVEEASSFYPDDDFYISEVDQNEYERVKIKAILALLFANATAEDFNNPCEFLKKRLDFFKNFESCEFDLGYSSYLKANLTCKLESDNAYNETPNRFTIDAVDEEGNDYFFPAVKFGISGNTAYVYAIQRDYHKNNSKRVSRNLYKIGEGFDSKTDNYELYEEGNLQDVTPSFLVVLDAFITYMHSKGIDNIEVPSILIQRWNAKEIANTRRLNMNAIDVLTFESNNEKQIDIQSNLTEKLLRTFIRLSHHYDGVDVTSLPMEDDSSLHLKVTNMDNCNNELLSEIRDLTRQSTEKNIIR